MSKEVCMCCRTELGDANPRVAEFKAATGAASFMNIRDGLTMEWVCPSCQVKMRPHVEAILAMLPDDVVEYLHWPSFVRLVRPRRAQ